MRKCCGPGQLYNYNLAEDISHADRCVKFSVSSSHRQSPAVQKSRDIFLGSKQSFPPRYSVEDVQFDAGFPRSCTPDGWDRLEPELRMGDLFYALSSGQLLVPHQFYFLEFDSYCIEDFARERDFKMARRVAFICTSQIQQFPKTAIDNSVKLRLDFIKSEEDTELFASKFTGRKVIRKCCGHNESFDSLSKNEGKPRCRDNLGFATRFFENLQLEEKPNDLFYRFGYANCSNPARTTEFQLNSDSSLEIKVDNTIANSSNLLVSIEDYCVDDMVEFDYYDNLPVIATYAFYCCNEEPCFIEPELTDGFELTESPSTDTAFTDSSFTEPTALTETTMSEPDSTYSNNDDQYDNSTLITIPKCCPPGHVMNEDFICQPLWWWSNQEEWDLPSNPEKIVSNSIKYDFKTYHNISNMMFFPNKTLSFCQSNQLPQATSLFAENSKVIPIFQNDLKNGLSVSIHLSIENYWDVKSKINSFCVDQLLFREEREVYYNAQVFHCFTSESPKIFLPSVLLISTVGLLMTFVIYFFVPASGSAKLVITAFGGKRNRANGMNTMAMMLTGRILLCHVISLALAFICLVIGHLQLVESGESSCVAIGYITYWAYIASFSWLTVYCFDYYYIFSGSFKVTNDRLFIPYSAFGWGVPILATITTIIAQFCSKAMGLSNTVNPNIGYDRCWFAGDSLSGLVIFYYVPVGILLLLDIYFFFSLIFNSNLMYCWQRPEMEIRSNRRISTASKEHEDLKMAVKLFFITGIPWIFEFISHLASRLDGANLGLYYFLVCCQLLNTSRGVFIFVNFILLNRDVRKFLWSHIKILFKREPRMPVDFNAINHADTDQSTSNLTTQSTPATCSETISNIESFEYDEYTYL
ncbi:uncharacterized protein LOC124349448 isoform X2 [Daphnia pulicaria]|nr:uncharacterized protein LOC124349448 isoform X2 [Daphnia pulicaria]